MIIKVLYSHARAGQIWAVAPEHIRVFTERYRRCSARSGARDATRENLRDHTSEPPPTATDVDFPTGSSNTDSPSKNTGRRSGEVREERHDHYTPFAA
jgi:hypothetical protein